jgi:hypothetical protein
MALSRPASQAAAGPRRVRQTYPVAQARDIGRKSSLVPTAVRFSIACPQPRPRPKVVFHRPDLAVRLKTVLIGRPKTFQNYAKCAKHPGARFFPQLERRPFR